MFYNLLYYAAILFTSLFSLFFLIYAINNLISQLMGSPYVPTSSTTLHKILSLAELKKGQTFVDLGSGDGRVVLKAVRDFQVRGVGIEINPLLVFLSRIKSRIAQAKKAEFQRANLFDIDLQHADIVFLFLMPKLLDQVKDKIARECKPNTTIISHGFKIDSWDELMVRKLTNKPFPTYYYKLTDTAKPSA